MFLSSHLDFPVRYALQVADVKKMKVAAEGFSFSERRACAWSESDGGRCTVKISLLFECFRSE